MMLRSRMSCRGGHSKGMMLVPRVGLGSAWHELNRDHQDRRPDKSCKPLSKHHGADHK